MADSYEPLPHHDRVFRRYGHLIWGCSRTQPFLRLPEPSKSAARSLASPGRGDNSGPCRHILHCTHGPICSANFKCLGSLECPNRWSCKRHRSTGIRDECRKVLEWQRERGVLLRGVRTHRYPDGECLVDVVGLIFLFVFLFFYLSRIEYHQ